MNLPVEICAWIDRYIADPSGKRPIGAQSRDEFVRMAVALVIMATRSEVSVPPLAILQDLVRRLEEKSD